MVLQRGMISALLFIGALRSSDFVVRGSGRHPMTMPDVT